MKIDTNEIRQRLSQNTAIDAKEIQALCDEVERNQWISVDDGLPEDKNDVLCARFYDGYDEDNSCYVAFYENGKWTHSMNGIVFWLDVAEDVEAPTHWMPLTKPPIK